MGANSGSGRRAVPFSATPAIAGATLYVGSYDGKFYALDARTGRPAVEVRDRRASGGSRRRVCTACSRRTRRSPIRSTSSCRARSWEADRCYFGSGDGNVYALDATSGDLRWKFRTGDVVHASPAYADGVVFFGSWDSYFYAVDAKTGAEKWRFHGGEDPLMHNQVGFQSSPAVVNGVVYIGCRDSNLYAIDAATGSEKWRFNDSGSWVISSPAVAQGKVIFGTSDSSALLSSLDAETGKQIVRQQGSAYMFSSPSVAGNIVYHRHPQRHAGGSRSRQRSAGVGVSDGRFTRGMQAGS